MRTGTINARRRFLRSALLGSVVAFTGVWLYRHGIGWVPLRLSDDRLAEIVRRRMPEIVVPERLLVSFARDYMANSRNMTPLIGRAYVGSTAADVFEAEERRVITAFLLWTNFLRLDDLQTGRLEYLGPRRACGNPLANFD